MGMWVIFTDGCGQMPAACAVTMEGRRYGRIPSRRE